MKGSACGDAAEAAAAAACAGEHGAAVALLSFVVSAAVPWSWCGAVEAARAVSSNALTRTDTDTDADTDLLEEGAKVLALQGPAIGALRRSKRARERVLHGVRVWCS